LREGSEIQTIGPANPANRMRNLLNMREWPTAFESSGRDDSTVPVGLIFARDSIARFNFRLVRAFDERNRLFSGDLAVPCEGVDQIAYYGSTSDDFGK